MTGPPGTIYIIRHGEKPRGPHGPSGVDVDGHEDEHSLTPRGWQRCGALAVLFGRPCEPLTVPDRLFCPEYGDHQTAHRPYQSLLGLSRVTGKPIETPHPVGKEADLAGAVLASGATAALICWDHSHIPDIAAAVPLDLAVAVPRSWPEERFDLVWAFTLTDRAAPAYGFRQLVQTP